jgi:hypothetical protein
MSAETVIQYAYQLAWGAFAFGIVIGVILVLAVLWFRGVIAEARRHDQFRINRRTPFLS